MEKALGIGGFFFRAKDPKVLGEWYEKNFGIQPPMDYSVVPWQQEAGITVFVPFEESTDYFGRATQQWMINFRVKSLDAMVAQLRANGNTVTVDETTYPNGRFGRVYDPEGNPIELWEPMEPK